MAPPLPEHLQSNRSSPERRTQVQQPHSPSQLNVNVSVSPQRSQARLSPIAVPIIERTPPRASVTFNHARQENGSVSSNSPKQFETFDLNGPEMASRRSPSPLFHHSSAQATHQFDHRPHHSREHSTSDDVSARRRTNALIETC